MGTITSSKKIIVDFEVNSLLGSPSLGVYVLKFSVGYSMPAYENEDVFFHKTSAKVYVGPKSIFLGIATPEVPKMYKPNIHPQKGGVLYEVIISKDSMEEVEKLRAGKDIEFKLDISGEYQDGLNQLCKTESIRYVANQKEWVGALKAMGFKGGLIFELPMDIVPTDEVKTALAAIEKAREHLYYGNYDDVVAKCRISLESVISNWGKIAAVRNSVKTNKKGMTKQQRFFHALDQIVYFSHLAHHPDENGEYISFTRSEAVFVLGSTIAAISSYVENRI